MTTDKATPGATRWRSFVLLCVPSLGVGAAMLLATANGALAASFAVSADSFKISADRMEGEGFAQFGALTTDAENNTHPVAPAGIAQARIYNLCQSAVYETPMGEYTIVIHAGTDDPVEATNLVLDSDALNGDATFENIEIGRDAGGLDAVPGHQGETGAFGQQADTIVIDDVTGENWSVTAGTFTLNGLDMSIADGADECF